MEAKKFLETLKSDFYTGVPDSLLKPLCDCLVDTYGVTTKHIVAANEGNSVALAAGYHLATGKTPVVYMQNSGIGNAINPIASLLNEKVYGIPCIFIVGLRGEPGKKDEPQHVFQGEITTKLLDDLSIKWKYIDKESSIEDIKANLKEFYEILSTGNSVAFIVKKGTFTYENKINFKNDYKIKREEIIEKVVEVSKEDLIISTTGKASRELFEVRQKNSQVHKYDFLTVGSMGHSSSIALGIALNQKDKKVWCIDGDGSALMHMGSMAVIGSYKPKNLIHIVINNESHETVGGLPTVSKNVDLKIIALGCGYEKAFSTDNFNELEKILMKAKESEKLTFVEIKSAIGSRENLGRPTKTPKENKKELMNFIIKE